MASAERTESADWLFSKPGRGAVENTPLKPAPVGPDATVRGRAFEGDPLRWASLSVSRPEPGVNAAAPSCVPFLEEA